MDVKEIVAAAEGYPAMQETISKVYEMMKAMYEQQPMLEPPISSETCRVRLGISETQFRRIVKRGNIPFFMVGNNYRFLWPQVLAALTNNKKKVGKANIAQ